MSIRKKLMTKVMGNEYFQRRLEKKVSKLQYYMGIGAGTGVESSGERAVFDLLPKTKNEPVVVFDVGANKGQFLGLSLELLSHEYAIHCFEPGAETFKLLSKSVAGNPRVHLNNIGLGKEEGELTLHYDCLGSGMASLTKRRLGHFGLQFEQSESVKISTVDGYCEENKIDRISLLKIDVEGHELDVLEGASNMLLSKMVDVVMFEFGGCNIDTRTYFQDFWYLFQKLDMQLFRITPSGYLHYIKNYKETMEQFRTTNFVAVLQR